MLPTSIITSVFAGGAICLCALSVGLVFKAWNLVHFSSQLLSFLPNGNAFVGWVTGSHISEHAPDGRLLMTAILSRGEAASYRSYKMPWVGRPADPPDVVANAVQRRASSEDLTTVVHVSWNGDTETYVWRFLEQSARTGRQSILGEVKRSGFETSLKVSGKVDQVLAVALDKRGRVLTTTEIVMPLPEIRQVKGHVPSLDVEDQKAFHKESL